MKNILSVAIGLLLLSAPAFAGQPWIFGSGEAVNLTNGTAYKNGVKNIAGSLNPSSTAVDAPSGSMYFSTSGTIYVKQDSGLTTNWLPLGIATTGSLTTLNGQSGPNVNIAAGSSGTDFNVAASSNTITLNIPTASASNRGLITSSDYNAFLAKQDAIIGAASTITSANLTANRAVISNGSGKIAASAVTDTELGYVAGVSAPIQTQIDGKEPTITAGTTADYWRGDKTWQTLDKTAVGLPNVDNTSDANKPISTATQTALNAKVDGAASSVDSEVMLYSGTTGKVSKRATGSGYAKLTSGVLSTSATVAASDLTGQVALANGGTNKSLTAVNGGVAYTDTDSLEVTAAGVSGQVLQSNGAAAPTWATKTFPTKSNAGLVVNAQRLITPNKQLTNVTGSDYYMEFGNDNILEDPSFEGSNQSAAWSLLTGSYIADNSPVDGTFNAELSLTATSLFFSQDSTLYASQFADGVQGLAMIRARTSVTSTPIYVCYRQAGTTADIATGCVQIASNNKWALYKIPFIMGGTSNGIAVTSNGVAITGSVELDQAFVGAVDLKQDINVVGPWVSFTPTGSWTTNTTYTGKYRQVGENAEYDIQISTSGAPTATTLSVNIPHVIDTTKLSTGTNQLTLFQGATASVNDSGSSFLGNGSVSYNSTTSVNPRFNLSGGTGTYTISAAASNAIPITFGAGDVLSLRFSVPVTQFSGASSVYSSQCGANCVDTFTALISSVGVVTKENADFINGNCTMSGTNSSTATCTFNSGIFTTAPNCTVTQDGTGGVRVIGMAPTSTGFVTQSFNDGGVAAVSSYYVSCSKTGADFVATRVIQGSFNGVVTTPSVTKPESFSFSYGATSNTACATTPCPYLDQIGNGVSSITRSAAGNYVLNFGKTYTKLKCTGNVMSPSSHLNMSPLACASCNAISFYSQVPPAGASTDSYGTISCQGYAP